MRIKLSKTDWKTIGQKMGWLKTADSEMPVPMGGPFIPDQKKSEQDADQLMEPQTYKNDVFSYLTKDRQGQQFQLLRHKADELLEKGTDEQKLHKAIYYALQEKYKDGAGNEYVVATAGSPFAREMREKMRATGSYRHQSNTDKDIQGLIDVITQFLEAKWT